jgi:hypothetical protein
MLHKAFDTNEVGDKGLFDYWDENRRFDNEGLVIPSLSRENLPELILGYEVPLSRSK